MPASHRTPFPLLIAALLLNAQILGAEEQRPAQAVDPLIGTAAGAGSCVPGPCLPHASAYPSPDTLKPAPSGFLPGDQVVGFSQLHTQGTGGVPSYGNFLLSPRIGPGIDEAAHASPIADVAAACDLYRCRLTRWDIGAAVVPAAHAALYSFEFPANQPDARLVLDVGRKIGTPDALVSGGLTIDPRSGTISGGGTYGGNWNPAPYELFFCLKVDAAPTGVGVWTGTEVRDGATTATSAKRQRMGAWLRFDTARGRTVRCKIAVSFLSAKQAESLLEREVPAWDPDALRAAAGAAWDRALAPIAAPGLPDAERRRFYTNLFHALVQPRDRSGEAPGWPDDVPLWDDQYTMWDTWKTLFPLLAIIDPAIVSGNVRSLIARQQRNGQMSTGFIQGREYHIGQGGDEPDNVIADAFAKGIPGIDWTAAWKALAANADKRTPGYREAGWVATGDKHDYGRRMQSGSGTLAFAYNDWCAAQVAMGVGETAAARRLLARSGNWRNVWDAAASDGGFTGFIRGRDARGAFSRTAPRDGYNTDFYEGTCWVYSYCVPHDIPGLVALMGGRERFIERLQFALRHDLIDFTNEPSFMTVWLFDLVQRPYLASFWADHLRRRFPARGYPGDDDSGAMSSLAIFLDAGFFPVAGQDLYLLHGPRLPRLEFAVGKGRTFIVTAANCAPANLFIQSVTLNGAPLSAPSIRHRDIVAGGTLAFVMGDRPSAWGCGGDFDPARADADVRE